MIERIVALFLYKTASARNAQRHSQIQKLRVARAPNLSGRQAGVTPQRIGQVVITAVASLRREFGTTAL
jgi:hypothetical protein